MLHFIRKVQNLWKESLHYTFLKVPCLELCILLASYTQSSLKNKNQLCIQYFFQQFRVYVWPCILLILFIFMVVHLTWFLFVFCLAHGYSHCRWRYVVFDYVLVLFHKLFIPLGYGFSYYVILEIGVHSWNMEFWSKIKLLWKFISTRAIQAFII